MATTTWYASKDAITAQNTSSGSSLGAGACSHLPVGYNSWLPGDSRVFIGFSYSFSGMTSIDSAILHLRTSTGYHIGDSNWNDPDVYIDLITQSWSEGTAGETWTGSNAINHDNQPTVSTASRVTWDVNGTFDPVADAAYSVDVTALVQEAFASGTFHGLRIIAVVGGSGGDRVEFMPRETAYDPYLAITYSTNVTPTVPTVLSPTGDAVVNTLTPTFTGTFNDPGDAMANAQVKVYADNGTTLKWDSGSFADTGATFSKVYSGPALTGNTFYKWKGRTADGDGAWSDYTALQRFKVNTVPNAPTRTLSQSPTTDVKTLTPTFNLTHSDPDASDSQMYYYRIIVETSAGTAVWDSGDVSVTPTVTKAVVYSGPALSWQTSYRWRARTRDSNSAWSAYSSNATFTTHTTGAPISMDPTGSETVGSLTPTFTGLRATTADSLTNAQIKVYASDGTTLIWDSGSFSSGVSSSAFSKIYSGTALSYGTTYKWQARVTSSVGGTSAYSSLKTFITLAAGVPTQNAPVGDLITDLTPDFEGTWNDTLKGIHIIVYTDAAGTQVHWDQGDVSETVNTFYDYTYAGTALAWNTQYWWKIKVQKNSDSSWTPYTGLTSFTTDSAGVPTLNAPKEDAWLGAPRVIDNFDSLTVPGSWTNGANMTAGTEGSIFQTGRGSIKFTGTWNGEQVAYRTITALDLSTYGAQTPIKIGVYISSLTSISNVRLRLYTDASNYVSYTITPVGAGAWETITVTKGSPVATTGTMNWASVTRIGISSNHSASVGPTLYVDNLVFDATAPSFDGTTFNSEVITTYRIRVYSDSAGTALVWDSGDTAGSSTTFSKLYTGTTLTKGTTYYWQARYIKSTGPTGAYSDLRPFVLNEDPKVPSSQTPSSGYVLADSLVQTFSAAFSDDDEGSQGDTASMFEVELYKDSNSTLVYSLLKDASLSGTNSVTDGDAGLLKTTGAENPVVNETQYKWRARYRDSYGAVGPWSSYNLWKPSSSPTTTISAPAHASTVTSSTPTISWSMASNGGKAQNSYRIIITRVADDYVVYDSGRVYSSAVSQVLPSGKIVNNKSYTVTVEAWDTDQLISVAPDTNSFSTSWSAPDVISGFTGTDDPALSRVILEWNESSLSAADFRKYTIYRKLSSETNWAPYVEITSKSTESYSDYMTANNVSYDYMITQFKVIPGDADLEGAQSDIATVILDTDSWFIVGADRSAAHIFEVPVTQAPFFEPVQQETFEPLGTNRKVIIRGRVLGAEGTMTAIWKDSERATAVEQINYIKFNQGPHILKSPFGDIWLVEFSGPTKEYAGGGRMTASLVWTEVDE